jgi:hypothetical protein
MTYTQVVFGLSPVRIGVIPVKYASEKHSSAAWRMTNAIESWSWDRCDGTGGDSSGRCGRHPAGIGKRLLL